MSDHLPESFSLASILAEQGLHHQEGLLSQNEWLAKDNRKLILSPSLQAMWQSCSGFSYPSALHPGALSPQNLLLYQHMCLLGQFISEY